MNTISSLIHRNLNRMLAVSLGVAGAVLILYSFLSLRQTERQAIRFVTSHVSALAQAGVNSQNVNEIDKEISRFTQTWKETQDLDLRIDIFLDGKLISHAGQLQPFKFLSSRVEENISLPSGDPLRIKVEIGLEKFLVFGAILLASFAIFIIGVFWILTKSMQSSIKKVTSPLELRIKWLKTISQELPASAIKNKENSAPTKILEIDELGESIGTLLRQIAVQEESIAQINFDRGRVKMAEQVSHSIKGIIATLQLKTSSLKQISDTERHELTEAVNTLREISGNLLSDKKASKSVPTMYERKEHTHVLPSIQTVVAAKTAQYAERNVPISLKAEASLLGAFSALDAGSLQTIVANLIDNSVEALEFAGVVAITPVREERSLVLTISDNGKGIPSHVLPLLMKEGATFGKPNGNGIGLYHANEILNRIGGKIWIDSVEGKGTQVHLSIPLLPAPHGFAHCLEIPASATLVMVDDDPLIHQAMNLKIQAASAHLHRIFHFSSVGEFESWFNQNGPGELGERVYFFDYDLKDQAGTGLDLIERHGLTFESVLISGMTEDPTVKSRIVRLGVKWLPKDFLAQVPILNLGREPNAASSLGAV